MKKPTLTQIVDKALVHLYEARPSLNPTRFGASMTSAQRRKLEELEKKLEELIEIAEHTASEAEEEEK